MGVGETPKRTTPHWLAVAMVLVISVVAISSCGQAPPDATGSDGQVAAASNMNAELSEDPPTLGGSLKYGLPFETNSWNPGLGQWEAHSMQVARAIFDPLFEYDEHGEPHPYLLERADHNADYTEWTLVVREGATFHNGRPVTAKDIASVQLSYMNSPVYSNAWAINDLTGAEIRDDRTLVVRSAKPWVTLPHQSASQLGFVPEPGWLTSDDWAHPIGSGPFMVDHWAPGNRIVLKRNPSYWRRDAWGNRLPYLDRIDFEVVADDEDRLEKLHQGSLDVIMQTAPGRVASELVEDAAAGEVQLVTDARGETPEDLVLLNTMRPGLTDPGVRRALARAIDRDAFSREVTGGISPPADGLFEPNSPWYAPSNYPAFEPERARAELDAARAGNPLTFVLKGPDTPDAMRAMHHIQRQFANVGVRVTVSGVKLSQMLITMMKGDFDMMLYQRFDYPNPATELVLVNPGQARPIGEFTLAFSRVVDNEIGSAIDTFLHSPDLADREEAMAVVQRRLGDLAPFLWLTHARRRIAARPGVVNLVRRTLPAGTSGLDFLIGSHRMDQVWLRGA